MVEAGFIEREHYGKEYVYRLGYWGGVLAEVQGRGDGTVRRWLLEQDLMTADLMTGLLVEARLMSGRTTWLAGDEVRLAGGFGAAAVGSVTIGGARFDFLLEADDGGSMIDLFGRKYPAYVR